MSRRKRTLLAVGLLFVMVTGTLAIHRLTYSPISPSSVMRIDRGMAKADVERMLGGPAGDYTTHPPVRASYVISRKVPDGTPSSWMGNERELTVYFDEDDKVTGVFFDHVFEQPQSALARVRRWLGL